MDTCNCGCHAHANLVKDLVNQGAFVPLQTHVDHLQQALNATAQLASLLNNSAQRVGVLHGQVTVQQEANKSLSELNGQTVTDLRAAQMELDKLRSQVQP
jgi:hypothetical protein